MFSENEKGEYDVFVSKYTFKREELESMTEQELANTIVQYTGIVIDGKFRAPELFCLEFQSNDQVPISQGDLVGHYAYEGFTTTGYFCRWVGGGNASDGGEADAGSQNTGGSTSTTGNSTGNGGSVSTTPNEGYTSAQYNFIRNLNSPTHIDVADNFFNLDKDVQTHILSYVDTHNTNSQINTILFFLQHTNLFWLTQQPASAQISIFNYLVQHSFSPTSIIFINQMINFSTINNSTFVIDPNITSSNAQVFSNMNEFQNYLNNFINNILDELSTTTIGNTKTARFKETVNLFTDFNVEVNQTMIPYNVNNVSSSMSGNTLGLTYEQTTDGGSAEVSTSNNVVTVTFTANLNFVLFTEGIGTIHTFHLTFIVKINKITGEPISIVIHGLP